MLGTNVPSFVNLLSMTFCFPDLPLKMISCRLGIIDGHQEIREHLARFARHLSMTMTPQERVPRVPLPVILRKIVSGALVNNIVEDRFNE